MINSADNSEQISAYLRKVLNAHGHGFHYAVVRRVYELLEERVSTWRFENVEFPVVGGGETTHIDLILRNRRSDVFVVGECKRADPARVRWCFAKAPYTSRISTAGHVIFDQLYLTDERTIYHRPAFTSTSRDICHLGLELKTGAQGDGVGQASQAINSAILQVLRGTSGLILHMSGFVQRKWSAGMAATFIPAIFTTAEIWVTDVDLGSADLGTGDLPLGAVKARKADWIWFVHNRSPRLRPDVGHEESDGDLSVDLKLESARGIAIISPDGIDEFLRTDSGELLA